MQISTKIYRNMAKDHVPSNIIKNDVDQRIGRRKNVELNHLLRREIVDNLSHYAEKQRKMRLK